MSFLEGWLHTRDNSTPCTQSAEYILAMDEQSRFSESPFFSGRDFGDTHRAAPSYLEISPRRTTPLSYSTDQRSSSQSLSNSPSISGQGTAIPDGYSSRLTAPGSTIVLGPHGFDPSHTSAEDVRGCRHATSTQQLSPCLEISKKDPTPTFASPFALPRNSVKPSSNKPVHGATPSPMVEKSFAAADHCRPGVSVPGGYQNPLLMSGYCSVSRAHAGDIAQGSNQGGNTSDRVSKLDFGGDSEDGDDDHTQQSDDNRNCDSNDQEEKGAAKTKASSATSQSAPEGPLNCPYYKRNKKRFNVRRHIKCTRPFSGFSSLKSVLHRSPSEKPQCADSTAHAEDTSDSIINEQRLAATSRMALLRIMLKHWLREETIARFQTGKPCGQLCFQMTLRSLLQVCTVNVPKHHRYQPG